jgi:hypothetical protein
MYHDRTNGPAEPEANTSAAVAATAAVCAMCPQLLKHHIVPPTVSQSSSQIIKQKKIGPVTVSVVVSGRQDWSQHHSVAEV